MNELGKQRHEISKKLGPIEIPDEYATPGEKLDRTRHGSPTFYQLLQEMAETHDKKSHDYASNDNPSGNYHFAGELAKLFDYSTEDMGFVGRLGEKMYRIANLEKEKKIARNESVEDTERDLCVIMALWMADRRDRRAKLLLEMKQKAGEQQRANIDLHKAEKIIELANQIQDTIHLTELGKYISGLAGNNRNTDLKSGILGGQPSK